ncbi:MAG: hypothetical protein D6B28_01260 [Gammaproteobacteria bacterium]|nr:MAG: hypothetical protein D6B28_01260 [Gammaproteobacteria bacterium]
MIFTIFSANANAVVRRSNGNGPWNVASTWTPPGVPSSTDDVVIENGHKVTTGSSQKTVNSLTVRSGSTLEGATPGDGVNIKAWGDINNQGTIKTQDVSGSSGASGSITLDGDDVHNTGTIKTGNADSAGFEGAHGGHSGEISISTPTSGTVTNTGTLETGKAGDGKDSDSSGTNGGDGGQSGGVSIKTGSSGNVRNTGTVKTGDGGKAGNAGNNGENGGNAGASGSITIDSTDIYNNKPGSMVTGKGQKGGDASGSGKKGGNGSSSGSISASGPQAGTKDKARKIDKSGGKTETGTYGEYGVGGPNGPNGARGKRGSINFQARVELIMGPESIIIGGFCILDGGSGQIILNNLDPDAITCFEEGVMIISDGGTIDLQGNAPGIPIIASPIWDPIEDPEGEIVFEVESPSDILLDPGVMLDDIVFPAPPIVTADDQEIPTLGEWGMLIMMGSLMSLGVRLRRRTS